MPMRCVALRAGLTGGISAEHTGIAEAMSYLRSPIADTSAPRALALGRRSQSSGLRKVAAALPEIKLNSALERARFNFSDFTECAAEVHTPTSRASCRCSCQLLFEKGR